MMRFFPMVFWTDGGKPIRMQSSSVEDHTSWTVTFAQTVAMEQYLGKRQQWAMFCKAT